MVNQMKTMKQNCRKIIAAGMITAGFAMSASQVIAQTSVASPDPEFDEKVREALLRNPEIMLEVFALLEQQQQEQQANDDLDLIASVADDLFEGVDLTKPVLVEFQDYNCGYCKRAHATVKQLKRGMPDLQLVIMEMPILGAGSTFAAEMALALKDLKGEEAYLQFSDALMTLEGQANAASVLRMLAEQGHDPEAIAQASKNGAGKEALKKAQRLARRLDVRGTPSFVGPSGLSRGMKSLEELAALAMSDESS